MKNTMKKILQVSMVAAVVPGLVFAATNNRRASVPSASTPQMDTQSTRTAAQRSVSTNRSATPSVSRAASSKTVTRSAVNAKAPVKAPSVAPAKASTVSRAATTRTPAAAPKKSGSNSARATALFNDVSKIGGGYESCRDSYATCMDQFCGAANDTYRRCFCSDKFTSFRDTADRLDEALRLLASFQDNNLEAVSKTAEEVKAMYSATAGERAIRKDTSASYKLLEEVDGLISGKTNYVKTKGKSSSNSIGVLDLSGISTSMGDDIWSGDAFSGGSSLFSGKSSSYKDMSDLEGKELYTAANKQCSEITREACTSDAMFNIARSAYSVFITQDCNIYEKALNAKRENVRETTRTAQKYLRQARLEEYQSANSADVLECLANVETVMKSSAVCGENYEKCLDFTGKYIDPSTGKAIYTPALFGLSSLIILDGSADILAANPDFDRWLDRKRTFVDKTMNENCRDKADEVWNLYKSTAIITISQAQENAIEEVKSSCIKTIKECYDAHADSIKEIDTTTAQSASVFGTLVNRDVCYKQVMTCAALYGDQGGCAYDDRTKKITPVQGKVCGLQSLLAYVDTVDAVKVAEGCESIIEKRAHYLCDVTDNNVSEKDAQTYPFGCKKVPKAELRADLTEHVRLYCATDLIGDNEFNANTIGTNSRGDNISKFNEEILERVLKDIFDRLDVGFSTGCAELGGMWIDPVTIGLNTMIQKGSLSDTEWKTARTKSLSKVDMSALLQPFYLRYYGQEVLTANQLVDLNADDKGWCLNADEKKYCDAMGNATYSLEKGCELQDEWFKFRCTQVLKGVYQNGQCVVDYQPENYK